METFLSALNRYFDKKMLCGTDRTEENYKSFCYPKVLPLMRFRTKRVILEEIGSITKMETSAMFGLMKLLTVTFVPNTGKEMPFLLIDCMEMKKKRLAYVEYYDHTGKELKPDKIKKIAEKYHAVPDYNEKDAWYVSERMEGSMIKGGDQADAKALYDLVFDSVETYLALASEAKTDPEVVKGLKAFQERMVKEGNPSSETMNRVLGKEEAERFFRNYIMPVP